MTHFDKRAHPEFRAIPRPRLIAYFPVQCLRYRSTSSASETRMARAYSMRNPLANTRPGRAS